MMDELTTKMLEGSKESLNLAAESDNSLDQTVYYSGRATTLAVTAVLMELVRIRELLEKLEKR